MARYYECNKEGKCFARTNGKCSLLTERVTGNCKFQKPERDVTDGVRYPVKKRG